MSTSTAAPPQPRYHPLWQLVLARLREFYREPEAVFWVYGFPILMIVLLGIAFRNKPVEKISVDIEQGQGAERIEAALQAGPARNAHLDTDAKGNGGQPRFETQINPDDLCRRRLRTGKTDLIVEIGPQQSGKPTYQYIFDPSRPESVLARDAVDNTLQRAAGRADAVAVENESFDEPGARYIDFLVPGLLGMSLMGGGLWGVGYVTVDMRIRKLLKRFLATPMRRSDFLAGIMVSRLLFMVPEVLVLLVFARLAFGVTVHGSLLAVVALILLGAAMFAGIGLLVASRARTLETVSGLMNLVMLPMWMMSGIFFSSDRFPAFAQPLVKALPLTPLIDALRAVMQEGTSLAAMPGRVCALLGWTVVSFALALRWFRWM
ncbi:MAG TPA: ABC transporter permease [Pirellulales bacterium]|jgi:ABC-type multidrug transport system permease subunit|nr:ABC transporter permease [Pirellulales bacterium]